MSDLVPVTFGLSPYERAQRNGYDGCQVISSVQLGDGDTLALQSKGTHDRGLPTSFLRVELPESTAYNVASFLCAHDALAQLDEAKDFGHSNCHTAAFAGQGLVEPERVEPALMYGYKLEDDEAVRIPSRQFDQLEPGQVYSFSERRDQRQGIFPTHSLLVLPEQDLHFSQLGWRGHPYIGPLEGALDYYECDKGKFFQVTARPRDLDNDAWYQRAKAEIDPADVDRLDRYIAEYEQANRLIKGLGAAVRNNVLSSV